MSQLQLSGNVDNRDEIIEALEARVGDLEQQLSKLELARKLEARAFTSLRQQLLPLHQVLLGVFGKLDALDLNDVEPVTGARGRTSAVWESWKQRLGASAAKCIDALLTHGELNTQQLAIVVGLHRTTLPAIIYKLNKAGLINKNGGRFSLKQL